MKKIFTLMAVFALTLAANAQKADFTVTGEGNDWIVLSLENDFNCGAFGFFLDLPEGTDLAFDDDEGNYVFKRNGTRLKNTQEARWTVSIEKTTTGYSINIYGSTVLENAGELIRFQLSKPVTGTATFYGVNFTDRGEDGLGVTSVYPGGDKTKTFTVDLKADAINSISAEQTKSGVIYNLAGQRVSKATQGIFIVDGKKVAVK